MKKGKFIVIDGTDGSGKATQTQLLFDRLAKEKVRVKKIDFPQYSRNFFGKLLRECLDGKLGDFIAVNPKIASVLYAADRWESSSIIKKWVSAGYTVIADRYVSANQIHQGGKIFDEKRRAEFMRWLGEMEFSIFKIPRPDAIIFLDLPIKITAKLLKKRAEEKFGKNHAKVHKDLADEDPIYLEKSRQSALDIVKRSNSWRKIDCSKNGEILSREEIHEKVYDLAKKTIK